MRPTLSLAVAWLIAVAAAASPAHAAPTAQDACPGNMLQNPNFEGGSRKTEREGTSLSSAVSNGWHPWFVRGDARVNREPEFKVEQVRIGGDPFRIRSGGQSMKWFTTWGTHTAGIYQTVNVRPGTQLTFSIHGMAYTGEADGWNDSVRAFMSDPVQPGNYRMQVGIDPTGARPPSIGNHPPDTVVWSEPVLDYDRWVPMAISATARGSNVTVYAKGQPEWAVKHNNSFWEDACLRVGTFAPAAPGVVEPAPAPAPVAAVAVAPAPAPAPSGAACRVRHTVVRGDTVFGLAIANQSTVGGIASATGLANPSLIRVGQVLCIP